MIAQRPAPGERMRCPRCRAVLRTSRPAALDRVLAFALATPPLMAIALTASFLTLSGGGARQEASVIDAANAVAHANTWPLALAVGALIVALPLLRALALAHVLLPIRLGRGPARRAARAFRLAVELRPWAMAEIFLIGVAVVLVKVSGLASVALGPAFLVIRRPRRPCIDGRCGAVRAQRLGSDPMTAAAVVTARESGLIACTTCGKVWSPEAEICGHCETAPS